MIELDPVRDADALCDRPGRAEFLSVDLGFVRALEDVLAALPGAERGRRARVAARLALELRSDPTTYDRRRALLTDARRSATGSGEAAARVAAELAWVHALWEPAAAAERLRAAERAVEIARSAGLVPAELEARMARVDALLGLGRLVDAEVELGTYALLAPPDDPDCRIFAASRRTTLCALRGRFDEAERAADEVAAAAAGSDRGDVHQVLLAVRGSIARERGKPEWSEPTVATMRGLVTRLPGQHHDAILARMLLELDRRQEARVELARALAALRAGRGPMWLVGLHEAAVVAAEIGRDDDREWVLAQLRSCGADFATYTLLFGGSVPAACGALELALGRPDAAVAALDRAVADLDAIGASPPAARARRLRAGALRRLGRGAEADADDRDVAQTAEALGLADLLPATARPEVWRLIREPPGWRLIAGPDDVRLGHSRGLVHLQRLVTRPRHEIPAVALEADGEALPVAAGLPALDGAARDAYRLRLRRIEEELGAAERRGDGETAAALESERAALVTELKRGLGLGGRIRRDPDAAERARINVTRSIRRAIDRITEVAPQAGLHLAASVRTGHACRYDPAPGGPDEWRSD
ncbi:MAG TPA: hypothetical protein VNC22_15445 [Sporichthya sp.]|nr:hypothetical protein [Sporichthya sp.]